jgi:hypothetical protein
MNKPSDYKHIAAWGFFLKSYQYYIALQQELAAKDQAPLNAIYKKSDGTWATADNINCQIRKKQINDMAAIP